MTGQPKDPLDLLRTLVPPEPDPVRMQATLTAVQARFAAGGAAAAQMPAPRAGWRRWFAPLATGLVAASLAGLWLLPGKLPEGWVAEAPASPPVPADTAPAEEDTRLARAPEAPDDGVRGEPMPSDTILGTRPTPEGPVIETEPLPAERHVFGAVEIVLRKDAGRVMLSLRHDGRELPFDSRSLDPGLELILLDAFVLPRAGGDLLLLRSRIGSAVNWDAFVMAKDAITLSPDLSLRIHDAPDRATVTQHLSAE